MVKSRRLRSSSSDRPYVTSGLREVRPYCSLRYVVTSKSEFPFRSPTVPKAMPTVHVLSAQPATIASTCSGVASVVRSRSPGVRPRKTSLTGPPTRATS
jgi:hypothetical protein